MDLEEALQVQDVHGVAVRHLQQLAEGRVRVDLLLGVQAVLLHVLHDATGHVGAGHLRALRLAEEHAQVVRDLLGLGEHAGLLGQGVARLVQGRGPRAAAAAGLLDLASQALLQLLHVGQHGTQGVAELVHLTHLGVELGYQVHLLLAGGGAGHHGGSGYGYRGGHRGRARGGGLGAGRGRRGRGRRGGLLLGRHRGGNGGSGGLRGGSLLYGGSLGAHLILMAGQISVSF